MKPNPEIPTLQSHTAAEKPKSKWRLYVFLAVAVTAIATVVTIATTGSENEEAQQVIGEVKYGQLTIGVDGDEGSIKPGQFKLIVNELEGLSTVVSMVDPGTMVNKGDLIMELDASALKDRKVDQEIAVQLSDAAFVRARETLAVVKKQNASLIKTATLNLQFAKQDVTKYIEGDYPKELLIAKSAIKLAESKAEDAKQVYEWSEKLFKKNFITQTDLNRDRLARDQTVIDLQTAKVTLKVLEEFTHKRQLAVLKANVDEMDVALILARDKALSDEIDAAADLKSKEIKLKREKEKLAKLTSQIDKSRITAPIDGMVLYIRDYRREEPLAVGSTVYERQRLINLPTTSKLQAELKVHESQLRKIKLGMPVEITTDAVANKTFWAKLTDIAVMPDGTHRFGNPHLKVYTIKADFTGETEGLRPGMSCKGKVIVEQFENVAYVPIQAVVQEEEESVVYLPSPDGPIRREVKLGLDNNVHIIVREGLAKGEKVLLTPDMGKSYIRKKQPPPDIPENAGYKGNEPDKKNPRSKNPRENASAGPANSSTQRQNKKPSDSS